MTRIIPSKAPSLPISSSEYSYQNQEQFSRSLRLYFAQVDANSSVLNGPLGAAYLNSPHVAACDTTDQFASGSNVATQVRWNTLQSRAGFTLNLDGSTTIPISGRYKIDYSLQLVNTDNVSHDVFVWLQVNGGPLDDSSSRFTIPARKSAGVFGYVVAYSSVLFNGVGGDEVRLWWATEQAYNPVGPVAGVYIRSFAAQTLPYVRPATPSAIGTIVFVSCPCEI
jgi:hypothetical protein